MAPGTSCCDCAWPGDIAPVRFGSETDYAETEFCRDCNTPVGGTHHYGCTDEEFPHGHQAVTCDECPVLEARPVLPAGEAHVSPSAVPIACSYPRCPNAAVPGGRGRCQDHRRTNAERGYPRHVWEAASRAQRQRVPFCERCGATTDLVADHVVNGDPTRLQSLCRSCNTAKRNREGGPVTTARRSLPAYPRGYTAARPGFTSSVTAAVGPTRERIDG